MEDLYINVNPDLIYYPIVDFNGQTGVCELSGESYMEETYAFYEPVVNWLQNYLNEKKPLTLNVKLTYFNTSSSRFILEIFDLLKASKNDGNDIKINWFYREDDPDMLSEIKDISEETGLEIKILKL